MKNEERDIYTIPPNFIEGGSLMGGMFRTRNVIEAGILAVLVGGPVLSLHFSLTVRIIILCLTALPLTMVALIGINGNSLSSFFIQLVSFIRNRRLLLSDEPEDTARNKHILPSWARKKPENQEHLDEEEQLKSRNRLRVDLKRRKVTQYKTFIEEEPIQKRERHYLHKGSPLYQSGRGCAGKLHVAQCARATRHNLFLHFLPENCTGQGTV